MEEQQIVQEPQQEVEATLSPEEIETRMKESLLISAKNIYAAVGGKQFSVYKMTRNTRIRDPKEATELLALMMYYGLVSVTGKGKSALFQINLKPKDQTEALKQAVFTKELEIRELKRQIETLEKEL